MQVFKFGFVAAVMVCTLSAMAQAADCTRVAASGDNVTHDLAVLFSTNALKNTIAGRGLVGKGPVKTTCKSGSAMRSGITRPRVSRFSPKRGDPLAFQFKSASKLPRCLKTQRRVNWLGSS